MMKHGWPLLVLSIYTLPALAGDNGFTTSAWLGLSGTAFDYEEFDDRGVSLDREEGWLPGVKAGLNLEYDQVLVETSLWWSAGRVDYTSRRVDTTTDEDIRNLEILAGTWFFTTDRLRAGLIAGGGYREWRRDILSTATASGLDETYRWGYGLLGLRGEQAFNRETRVIADLHFTRTLNPKVNVDFAGRFDDVSLALVEETGFRARLAIDWQLATAMTLWLAPWYEYWELGRSADAELLRNGVSIGTVFEPRSETRNAGITVGVIWRFDEI
ncbi:MAG: hypothetical protein ABFR65_01430 [Pseudomonadota bacterium]